MEDKIDEATGAKARRNIAKTRKKYEADQWYADMSDPGDTKSETLKKYHDYDVERANESKALYEKALDEYGNHPIGRLQNTFGVLTGKKKVRY